MSFSELIRSVIMNLSESIKATGSGLALVFLSGACLWGQVPDNGHVAPKPVPQMAAPASIPGPAAKPQSGVGGSGVLIAKLKALVFVPTPTAVDKAGTAARGIVFKGVTVPSEPDFRKLASSYLGQRITGDKLNTLISDIILYYRNHDRPVIDVIVPEQEITNGGLQVVLLEGKLGKVIVTGNRWFSSSEIADGIAIKPGESISQSKLQGDLDWLNQNPFRTTDLVYNPGEKLGETDLVLQTHDRFPVRVYAGYEDSGNAPTGFDRYLTGFNYGDLFGIGQQLNYQYTISGDGESLRAHAGSYIIPLPWHNTLTFFGNYVDTKGSVPPLIGLIGRSYQISGRYTIPLPTLTFSSVVNYKHDFSAGFDYKYNNNSLEFGGVTAGDTLYDIDQFVMGYTGTENDPYGQMTINDQLYVSPGSWGGNNNDAAFNATHEGATSDYVYNTLILQRLTKLPEDWTLVLRGTVQTSNANLMPSEQLGFGGYDTVRGYDEREVNADDGYIFTTELRSPPISLGELFGSQVVKDQLQFLGFWDYGAAHDHALLAGEPSEIPLSSLGFGVRYSINTYLSLRYDYGFQLLSTGFDNDHGSRSDLGIVVSY
jgi:hemolysin activation/secretion protein